MLSHADIWRAIDRLAEANALSPSGLARKAGLSATLFNPSKRINGSRKRWPSTESIAAILQATNASLDTFVALASPEATQHGSLPLLGHKEAARPNYFDEAGLPSGKGWDEMPLPGALDAHAFVLEITSRQFEPTYREGARLLFSPAEALRRGDIVGVRTKQGEIFIKRLGRNGAQKIELLALGEQTDEPPTTLLRQEIAWVYRLLWASGPS